MFSKKNITTAFAALLCLLIAYFISFLMLKGVAAPHKFRNIITLTFFITIFGSSKKIFWYLMFPIICCYALYTPIGLTYGHITQDFIFAGLATDILEAKEFIRKIPSINYLHGLIIIITTILYRVIVQKTQINFHRNKTFISIALMTLLFPHILAIIPEKVRGSIKTLMAEQTKLSLITTHTQWKNINLHQSTYNTYVLVIGESARKDYHNAYGYPIENTPFMSTHNGILIDGLIGGGMTTVPSLKAMLTKSDTITWDADYSLNFIDLFKQAGYQTYWLSNQGYLGYHDTPISAIAKQSHHTFFLKYGDYSSANTSDFLLLDEFNNIIEQHPTQKKLIVVHLYGSHSDACKRISDYTHKSFIADDPMHKDIACYVSSIRKTDEVLEKLFFTLNQSFIKNHEPFSMIYFSDHGQTSKKTDNQVLLGNYQNIRSQYEIPLFKVSSDDSQQQYCQSFKSGLNFTNGLANWAGITADQLNPQYNLFDCIDDIDDYSFSKKVPQIHDPAINIQKISHF